MESVLQRINELGIELPQMPSPIGNFAMGVEENAILYLSVKGHYNQTAPWPRARQGLE